MITLYLARHGETDGNVQQWYQGSTDVPSMPTGWNRPNASAIFSAIPTSMPYTAVPSSGHGHGGMRSGAARLVGHPR